MKKITTILSVLIILILVTAGCINENLLTKGLVCHLNFNENAGTIAYDTSGNNNNGTINGATWGLGIDGSGLNFDGTNDYVIIDDSSTLHFGNSNFSVCAWIKTNYQGDKIQIIEKMNRQSLNPFKGFYLRITDDVGHKNTLEAYLSDGISDVGSYSTTIVNDGNWHFIVVTFDRTNDLSIYIDGDLEFSEGISHIGSINVNHPLYIGQQDNNDNLYDGTIDDVRIYNRILNYREIQFLYKNSL